METALSFPIWKKIIYNDTNMLIVSLWGIYSYLNNEQIKIGDVLLMNFEYG